MFVLNNYYSDYRLWKKYNKTIQRDIIFKFHSKYAFYNYFIKYLRIKNNLNVYIQLYNLPINHNLI